MMMDDSVSILVCCQIKRSVFFYYYTHTLLLCLLLVLLLPLPTILQHVRRRPSTAKLIVGDYPLFFFLQSVRFPMSSDNSLRRPSLFPLKSLSRTAVSPFTFAASSGKNRWLPRV